MARVPLPVLYSQFDPQWAKHLLGHNIDPKYSIYNFGCLLCSLANVCKYYGYDETPLTLQEKLKAVGGFANGGEYVWGSLTKIYPDIKEESKDTPEPLTDGDLTSLKSHLDAGNPVLVKLDYNPKTVAVEEHYSLLVDYDPNDENNFTLADTLGGVLRSLKSYLAWFKPSARVSIERYVIYSKVGQIAVGSPEPVQPAPQPEPHPQSAPQSALPENYADIVHGSSQWDEIVKRFLKDRNPKDVSVTDFDVAMGKFIDDQIMNAPTREVIKEVTVGEGAHAASQWEQTVEYLELGKIPSDATFEDAKRKIAGYKSAVTDYKNKATEALKEAARKDITIKNQEGVLSNLTKQVTRDAKLHRAEVDTLIRNTPSFTKLRTQYEASVKELQGDVERLTKENAELRLHVSDKTVESNLAPSQPMETTGGNERSLLSLLRHYFKLPEL